MNSSEVLARALLTALGCPDDKVTPAFRTLCHTLIPDTPEEALAQARAAIEKVSS